MKVSVKPRHERVYRRLAPSQSAVMIDPAPVALAIAPLPVLIAGLNTAAGAACGRAAAARSALAGRAHGLFEAGRDLHLVPGQRDRAGRVAATAAGVAAPGPELEESVLRDRGQCDGRAGIVDGGAGGLAEPAIDLRH